MPRLFAQAIAVSAVLAALPIELRVLPPIPLWIERLLLFIAAIWFVNLVNFMDGIDWMTVNSMDDNVLGDDNNGTLSRACAIASFT